MREQRDDAQPGLVAERAKQPRQRTDIERVCAGLGPNEPKPKIWLLYGSLRERSFSRLAVEEAARVLQPFGAETRIFSPRDLPLPDHVAGDDHPAVHELRELPMWSDGPARTRLSADRWSRRTSR